MGSPRKPHVSDCVDSPPVATRTYFLEKNFQKKLTAAERSKVHAPSRCWGPMAPAEALRRSLAGGLRKPHGYEYGY